jgi:DNA-binding response OmpR family regulator
MFNSSQLSQIQFSSTLLAPCAGDVGNGDGGGMSKKKIIIVDDDQVAADALKLLLSLEEFQVDVVHDGQSAIQFHEIFKPDLMILDVAMPEKDGLTVCKEIRQKDNEVLILMVTAQKMQVNTVAGLGAGADGYMTKPVGPKELVARVRSLLRRSDFAPQ